MSVLVCDDQELRCNEIVGKIREAGLPEPKTLVGANLTTELKNLFKYVRACMDTPETYKPVDGLLFDDADLVILDNNLAHLEVEGTRLTAESIAGYIRAFTAVPYILSLNKNPDVDFDLRYLVGDYSTRADLALNSDHLANPALWTGNHGNAKDGFIPWYWPNLSKVAARRRAQIKFVLQHLDDSVVAALGFDDEAIGFLSLHARGALSPEAESDGDDGGGVMFNKLTFRDVFIARDRSLPFKGERERLSSAEKGGNAAIREIIARSVAADIDLWFRRDVVGPQEPLVDVPHLLMRFPFLLGNRAGDVKEWDRAVSAIAAPYGLEQKLYADHLAKTKFQHDVWVPATCFWWPKLKADEKLNEFFFEAKEGAWADAVFCEDRSVFLERSPERPEGAPVEFPAEFEGSWGRRYVARLEGMHYAPRSRFAI